MPGPVWLLVNCQAAVDAVTLDTNYRQAGKIVGCERFCIDPRNALLSETMWHGYFLSFPAARSISSLRSCFDLSSTVRISARSMIIGSSSSLAS
jgi:hypothetical protein